MLSELPKQEELHWKTRLLFLFLPIGGYFLFGHLNSVRHLFEWMDDLRKGNEPDEAAADDGD